MMSNKEDLIILKKHFFNKIQNLQLYFSDYEKDIINLNLLLCFLAKENIIINKIYLQFDLKNNFSKDNFQNIINRCIKYNNSIIIETNFFIQDLIENNKIIFSNIKIDIQEEKDLNKIFSYNLDYIFILNSKNIKFWEENYLNIINKYNQYYNTPILHFKISQNLKWDEISINIFQNFLLKIFDYYFSYYKENLFIKNVLLNKKSIFYIQIPDKNFKKLTQYSCNLHNYITIYMVNLSIIPCRLFNQLPFMAGQIQEQNLVLKEGFNGYMNLILKNPLMNIDCNVCNYRYICTKTCPALNYIQTGDYNINQNQYCKILKIKYYFLFNKLKEKNLFNYILKNESFQNPENNWLKEFLIGQAEKIL